MKQTVLRFGLISGAVAVLLMFVSLPLIEGRKVGAADGVGYTSMVLAVLLVFFGVRSYRERAGAGRLTFGRGLAVGLLITLVACACSVVGFQVLYFLVAPDFGDTFAACMIERVEAGGATPERLEAVRAQAATLKRLYDSPWTNAALTFGLNFPVGLVGSLVAAAVLRRR